MFELNVALKYLIPRWRQLSVSIISLISILVISLVVWLILVFFSVTHGLEKTWIEKMTTLTAPIRLTPTDNYYRSYYYNIDSLSEASDYLTRSLSEKLTASLSNPYNDQVDPPLPKNFPKPDLDKEGNVKDIVKLTVQAIEKIPGVSSSFFEVTFSNIQIYTENGQNKGKKLSQGAYIGSFTGDKKMLQKVIRPLSDQEKKRLQKLLQNFKGSSSKKKFFPFFQSIPFLGEGVLLPFQYKKAGISVGDRGYLTYYTPTTSSVQEQKLPIYVSGFYDQGIIPIGGRFILTSPEVTSLIARSSPGAEKSLMTGINVRFDDLDQAKDYKKHILALLKSYGVEKYWKVQTFREYEFTKDVLQQLSSEKNIFSLIAAIMILVACSNIISMLIILVNDKKHEIGVLRALGASSFSVSLIFGICGLFMGAIGSLIGTIAGIYTLRHLDALLNFISSIQGYAAFNSAFYGEMMPNALSLDALYFVWVMTAIISILAGVVPAIKASFVQPASILREQ